MNTALLHALDEEGKTLINIDLIEGSHEANAFDKRLPRPLASKAAAFASQIVELSSCSNVTIIGQEKLVNDILKAAIKANKCQSTINFLGLSHPTNGSANAFGTHLAFSFAAEMNHVFHQSLEKVNWKGLILDIGSRLDKHNGKGGVITSITGDRSSEIIIDIPTANPHINVVAHCNALGIIDDNDVRLKSMIGHLVEPHTRTALYLSMKGTVGGKNSHATDSDCQPGEHWIYDEERYSMSDSDRGRASHATDPNCEDGEHCMKNGEMSMPTLERVTNAGFASADTIDGKETGVHLRVQGVGAGVDLTPSMSARGSESLGIQNTEEPLMLLQLVSSTVEPDAPPVSKYSRNQAEILDVLLKNQFFKSVNGNTKLKIKEWKDAAGDSSDDNSHTFMTKLRKDNAPRASDKWKLSLHESEEVVKLIAPDATEVNKADRAVSASFREGQAQRKKESQKRKP